MYQFVTIRISLSDLYAFMCETTPHENSLGNSGHVFVTSMEMIVLINLGPHMPHVKFCADLSIGARGVEFQVIFTKF